MVNSFRLVCYFLNKPICKKYSQSKPPWPCHCGQIVSSLCPGCPESSWSRDALLVVRRGQEQTKSAFSVPRCSEVFAVKGCGGWWESRHRRKKEHGGARVDCEGLSRSGWHVWILEREAIGRYLLRQERPQTPWQARKLEFKHTGWVDLCAFQMLL